MKFKKLKSFRNKIILFILGFICCSSFSTYISFKLGLPFGTPEIFLLFFLPFFYREFVFFKKIFLNRFFKIFVIFFILLSLGLIFSSKHAFDVLASSRAYLYLIIFFSFGYSKFNINLNKLFYIVIGSVIGSYIYGLLLSNTNENVNVYSSIISFAILVSYPLIKKDYFVFIICLIGALCISFYSGLRRQIVEVLLSIIFTSLLIILRDKIRLKLFFVSFFIIPFLIYNFISYVESYFHTNNPYLWRRIFLKTQKFGGPSSPEESRFSHFYNLVNYVTDTIIPKGIYPRGVSFKVAGSGGSTLDFPLYEIFYVFGSLTAIVFIIFFVKRLFTGFKLIHNNNNNNKNKDEIIMISSISILLFCASFFDGGFLQYTYVTPFSGFVLGRLFFFKKKTYDVNSFQ